MPEERKQWTGTIGPRQRSALISAWRSLGAAYSQYNDPARPDVRVAVIELGAGPSQKETEAKNTIGERFDWTVSRKTCAAIIKAVKEKTAERLANLPDLPKKTEL